MMDDDVLLRHLQSNEDDASEYADVIGQARVESAREYYRDAYEGDDELEGWSTLVTSEVQDTVEWTLPELLDVFTTSDQAVVFEPTSIEDVAGAQQATDACNYVFYKQNNGFLVLYTAFKDALIADNGAIHWYMDNQQVRDVQDLQGATLEMLALAEQDGYTIERVVPVSEIEGQPIVNARVSKLKNKKAIKVEAFPISELLVKRGWGTPDLQDCPYVARVTEVTLSDLKRMGFNDVTAEELGASDEVNGGTIEDEYRDQMREGMRRNDQADAEDESLTTGWLRIEYVLVDYDGDGIAERRVIHRLGKRILANEETDHVQIATASPIINTHQWDGMGIARVVSDIQRVSTDLNRAAINSANLSVNPRKTVLTNANGDPLVDMDDLLDFRVGGIVRQSQPNALSVEAVPFNATQMLPMLAHIEQMAERRTGVSKRQQGLDSNALRQDRTAAEVMMTANAAKQRVKLVARIFAETLLKPVFLGIFKLLTSGEMEAIAFRLRGQFVRYDPNEWRDQYDMTVNVGLGTGDKQQQISFFNSLMQMQMGLAQSPFGGLMIDPMKVYNTVAKIVELGGQKNVNDFIGNPEGKQMPQQPPPPQAMLEQAKLQQAMQLKQMDMQADAQKFQAQHMLNMQAKKMEADAKRLELEMQLQLQSENDRRDAEREMMKASYEAQLEAQRIEIERQKLELKKYEVDTGAQTQLAVASMRNQSAHQNAQI